MALFEPRLAVLDETDSGLDIDALKTVSEGVNALRDPARSVLLITHYQRLLDYIEPDYVHVLADGWIVRSGDKSLAKELDRRGYAWLTGKEEAVSLIVNGFCKEIFNELPMEFAVEAQKLLAISLEGAVG